MPARGSNASLLRPPSPIYDSMVEPSQSKRTHFPEFSSMRVTFIHDSLYRTPYMLALGDGFEKRSCQTTRLVNKLISSYDDTLFFFQVRVRRVHVPIQNFSLTSFSRLRLFHCAQNPMFAELYTQRESIEVIRGAPLNSVPRNKE
jgi:hypothetical protein